MISNLQIFAIVLWIVYLFYEFYFISNWQASSNGAGPFIRLDLFLIWPLLSIITIVAVVQEISQHHLPSN